MGKTIFMGVGARLNWPKQIVGGMKLHYTRSKQLSRLEVSLEMSTTLAISVNDLPFLRKLFCDDAMIYSEGSGATELQQNPRPTPISLSM